MLLLGMMGLVLLSTLKFTNDVKENYYIKSKLPYANDLASLCQFVH